MVPVRVQSHGQAQWWEHHLWDSYFLLDFLFFTESAAVLPDHAHFFPTETRILDRHAEEREFVLLVVGGKASW